MHGLGKTFVGRIKPLNKSQYLNELIIHFQLKNIILKKILYMAMSYVWTTQRSMLEVLEANAKLLSHLLNLVCN